MEFVNTFLWTNPSTSIELEYTLTITTDTAGKVLGLKFISSDPTTPGTVDYVKVTVYSGVLGGFSFYGKWFPLNLKVSGSIPEPDLWGGYSLSDRGNIDSGWGGITNYMTTLANFTLQNIPADAWNPEVYTLSSQIGIKRFAFNQYDYNLYNFNKLDLTNGFLGEYTLTHVDGFTNAVEAYMGNKLTVTKCTKAEYEAFKDFKYYNGNPFNPPYAPVIDGPGWWWQ